ncbi:MAG: WD40 repeat domain-containing protein, partial [Bacteroidota bacterium]|nr:WD40 repeat domain-containing protein [Bacteroidota bacterium]
MKHIIRLAVLVTVIFSRVCAQEDRIALHLEEGKSGAIWDLVFSSDGKMLWSCGRDSTVKAWNFENGEAVLSLRAPHATLVTSLALSPDDALVAAGDMNGHILIWEAASGALLHDIAAHKRYISDIAFTPDGRTIAACGRDDTLSLWDASTGRELRRIAAGCVWVNALSVSHDGSLLATAGQDGSVKVWDLAGGSLVRVLGRHRRFARTVLFTPDDAVLLSGGRDGSVRAWDVRKGILLQDMPVNIGFPHHLALDPPGKLLAVSMMNGLLEIWDWGKQTRRASIPNSYGAMAAAFQPHRPERLASAHTDGAVRVWNAQDGTEIVDFVGFSDGQWLTFTPDGYYDCSAFGDRYVQWRKGEELYPLARYQALYKQPSVIEDALAGTYTPERRLERIADPPLASILAPRDGQLFAFGTEPLEVIVEARAWDVR